MVRKKVKGEIVRVSGPVVVARNVENAKMYDMVLVGEKQLIGEIIQLRGNEAVIQVYEVTDGVGPGEPVESLGMPLSVELGPGLIGGIYDGILRPLNKLREKHGDFIARGVRENALDRKKKWDFKALVKKGVEVKEGDVIGEVQESSLVVHKVMVPPGVKGKIDSIKSGKFTVEDVIAVVKDGNKKHEIKMLQRWPVRKARPYRKKIAAAVPFITGQRVLDTFFPLVKGGTAAIPGGFGTGKTVTQHQLAKWSDAQIIIFIGCGERGNEMTEVLTEFPELKDPHTGEPLMNRTILIANTSDMPVAAREASIYTGITLAEYYRDMGYDVALMADSTSRWAEALREIAGRLGEMPSEEGYPAYLASRLAAFYERSGRVEALGSPDRKGSLTLIGAVSPPGGDFSEPVTQNTLRIVKVFWALSSRLAYARHYPSVDWLQSYSLYKDSLRDWTIENVSKQFAEDRVNAMKLLQKEAELEEIVKLVGMDALPDSDKLLLDTTRMIREDFLQQNAFDEIDTYSSLDKQAGMLRAILTYYEKGLSMLEEGIPLEEIEKMEIKGFIARMKGLPEKEFFKEYKKVVG